MICSVSSAVGRVLDAVPPRSASRVRWFFKVPDLSDETAAAISKANAWPTFIGICRAIHDRGRRGTKAEKAAADNGMIGVGKKGLARASGVGAKTVRRQLDRLAKLGLVVVHDRGIIDVADPTTGKITTNRKGRTPTSLVYLTITESHMRPAAAKAAARLGGAKCHPSPAADRGHNAPPSIERTIEKRKTPPTPQQDAVLADGEAGGHAAAQASQERGQIVHGVQRQDDPKREAASSPPAPAGTPEPNRETPVPVGNVVPPERSGRRLAPEPTRSCPSGWSGLIAKGAAENSSSPDGGGFRGGSWRAEYEAATGRTIGSKAADTIERDRAADGLRKALDDLPDDSQRRAQELGHAVDDGEAAALQRLLDDQRRQAAVDRRAEAAATKEAAREAYHRQKAAEAAA